MKNPTYRTDHRSHFSPLWGPRTSSVYRSDYGDYFEKHMSIRLKRRQSENLCFWLLSNV